MRRLVATALVVGVLLSSGVAYAGFRETELHGWVNDYRRHHGIAAVTRSWPLDYIAEKHSREMASNGELSRVRMSGTYGWLAGHAEVGTLHRVWRSWAFKFRSTILDRRWDRDGIGVVRTGSTLWVTIIFRGDG